MARIATPIATFAQRGPGGTPGIAIDFIEVEHAAVFNQPVQHGIVRGHQMPGSVRTDSSTLSASFIAHLTRLSRALIAASRPLAAAGCDQRKTGRPRP